MSSLETVAVPQKYRRISIDPVTRVEGHGKVTILLDDDNQVHQVRLHIVEFRGFEIFIEGRPYWEVPVTVQRLCGICPVSHHLAAVKAMDIIAGAKAIPPTAEKLRRLMHYGQILQSHALHFFHLSSPDLLLGFDSDVTKRNIIGVVAEHPELARQGVLLRKFGQEVIRHTSGKRIHGTGAIPGGMNKALTISERDEMRCEVDQVIAWARKAVQLTKKLFATNPEFYDRFGMVDSNMMSIVDDEGRLDLYHGGLRVKNAEGRILLDHVDYATYDQVIGEEVKPWTYMKFPYLCSLGPEKGWYKVGPLARVQTADRLSTPFAEEERHEMMQASNGRPVHGALQYHVARLIELLHAAEVIRDLLDDPDITGTDLLADFGPRRREAVGAIEAPRGTLFHHYRVDEEGLVDYCNLIVSTTNNNQAMNEAVRHVARHHLSGRTITEGLLNRIEVAIRAYDPCLSCATHALGQMPLEVELRDPDGALVHKVRKDSDAVSCG
ncbi:NAD-reducing hydrogenase subunit HoxH [Rhodovulum sp. PH10]|uniref:Ni/Fe hydrogenase subunit alpha n=1 Tax=Rhodovulum sp. PH10 TaxID=1187851 RepID=UPI00027C261A|nr:Ni/Fe hydrogenase subunit alpha [Rhodovulum sp. PH10]EJW12641.1 NAD-reducing hydrogenase subunit HoxH [Rhodovulum sp. PH10]